MRGPQFINLIQISMKNGLIIYRISACHLVVGRILFDNFYRAIKLSAREKYFCGIKLALSLRHFNRLHSTNWPNQLLSLLSIEIL